MGGGRLGYTEACGPAARRTRVTRR